MCVAGSDSARPEAEIHGDAEGSTEVWRVETQVFETNRIKNFRRATRNGQITGKKEVFKAAPFAEEA
jgi:RPA family protein